MIAHYDSTQVIRLRIRDSFLAFMNGYFKIIIATCLIHSGKSNAICIFVPLKN